MKIKQKLVLAFTAIALMVTVVGYVGLRSISNIRMTFEELKSDIVPGALAMGQMESASQQMAHDLMDYMIAAGEQEQEEEEEEEEVKSCIKLLTKAGQEHLEHGKHIGGEEKREAEELLARINGLASAATEIISLKKQGAGIDELLKTEDEILHPALHLLAEQLARRKAVHMEELAEAQTSVSQAQRGAYKTILLLSIVTLVTAISIGLLISRTICSPIIELQAAAAEIGKGKLDTRIEIKSKDEIGQLSRAFDKMTDDLKKTTASRDELDAANQQLQANEQQLKAGNQQLQSEIEERKQVEEKLAQTHKKMIDTAREVGKGEVATSVLHNVGNVVNSVNVTAGSIKEKLRDSKISNIVRVTELLKEHEGDLGDFLTNDQKGQKIPLYLESLSEHLIGEQQNLIEMANSLTGHVQHITEIISIQQSFHKTAALTEVVSVDELIEEAVAINVAGLGRHDVNLRRQYQQLPTVVLDRHKLLQIVINLVSNAKYAVSESKQEDKLITIRTRKLENDQFQIEVCDNGTGIPAEDITRIFSSGFTTRKEGHGYGLHSAALTTKEMGGSLNVSSEGPGKGATFTLQLPLKPANRPCDTHHS